MLTKYLIGIFMLFAAGNSLQADTPYIIHLDKSFYVTGEVIWYKLLLPEQEQNAVVKVVLTNRSGKTLFYTFIETDGRASVHGYYKIPFDLPSEVYRLSFLGRQATDQQTVILAGVDIPIYNDGQAMPTEARAVNTQAISTPNEGVAPQNLRVQIELVEDTIRSRNQVQAIVNIQTLDGRPVPADLSVAVTDGALTGPQTFTAPTVISGQEPQSGRQLDSSIFLRAQLLDYYDRPIKANVLGVLAPRAQRIYYTRALEDGSVYLKLPDFYGSQPIQFLGLPGENDSIQIRLLSHETLKPTTSLTYTPQILDYLEWSRQRKKIYQLYTDLEFTLSSEVPAMEPQTLQPDAQVRVADYEPFDNLALFFKEILTPLVFRVKKDGRYEAKIYTNRGRNFFRFLPGEPLFIVDGKATRDANYIARMKTDQIETVQVFSDQGELRRQFNVLGNSGVIIIKTSSKDITVPELDADDILLVNGLQPPAQFPVFRPDPDNYGRHRPFFRPQLYWNPNVVTSNEGEATIDFYQSDAKGEFLIRVLARDAQGRLGYGEATYYATW